MKQGELKVIYKDKADINIKLDKAIEKCLKKFGYKRWASGFCLKSERRNIAFELKK